MQERLLLVSWPRVRAGCAGGLTRAALSTTDCQKADWKAHSYHCRKPDAELRKEKEKGFMGIKNAVQIGVDVVSAATPL